MVLAWFGTILGALGVILAVVALARTVPVLAKEPVPGYWKVTNQGPADLVVTKAFVIDEDQQHLQLGQWVDPADWDFQAATGMLLPSEEYPWCVGRVLMAQEPFLVETVGVGRELHIKYRVQGFLGLLSRGDFVVIGGI